MSNKASIILNLLSAEHTMTYNRLIANAIGLNEAVAYASLIAKFAYYERNNLLDEEGYFYCTINDLQKSTSLTKEQQNRVIKRLVKLGLILYKRKGIPPKRFIKIVTCYDKITEIINNGIEKNNELELQEAGQTYINQHKSENPTYKGGKTRLIKEVKPDLQKSENPTQNINNINIKSKYKDINNNINTTTKYTTNTKYSKSTNKENNSSSGLNSDEENKEVYDLYLQEISRDKLGLSALTIDCLKRLISEYGGEKVVEAIKISVYQNKRSLRYIEGVLKKQKKEGEESVKPKRDTKQEIDWSKFD